MIYKYSKSIPRVKKCNKEKSLKYILTNFHFAKYVLFLKVMKDDFKNINGVDACLDFVKMMSEKAKKYSIENREDSIRNYKE